MAVPQKATGEARRQRLHLQHRSGKTHNGRRVGAHGISVSWKEFQKIDGECGQCTHSQDTSVQHSLITAFTAQLMRLAQELHCHLCVWQEFSHQVSYVSSMVVLSRGFLHELFLFFTYLFYHTTRTLSTSRTSPRSPRRQVASSIITVA